MPINYELFGWNCNGDDTFPSDNFEYVLLSDHQISGWKLDSYVVLLGEKYRV